MAFVRYEGQGSNCSDLFGMESREFSGNFAEGIGDQEGGLMECDEAAVLVPGSADEEWEEGLAGLVGCVHADGSG